MFMTPEEMTVIVIIILELTVPLVILAYLFRRGLPRNRNHIR